MKPVHLFSVKLNPIVYVVLSRVRTCE